VEGIEYERERVETWDDDFIDFDWSRIGSKKLIIVSHGIEGNSSRHYAKGLSRIFNSNEYDVLVWNLRGCSGEDNRQLYTYHSGKTDDLDWVVQNVAGRNAYDKIHLVGISLGGNLTLKYLGEEKYDSVKHIESAVAVSVPSHYETSFPKLLQGWNRMYERRFTQQVIGKVKRKEKRFPDALPYDKVYHAKNLWEFTELVTAPLHDFKDVNDFNKKVQAHSYLDGISTPTLLVNANNDPLLTKQCYPEEQAKRSKYFHLETTINGGHMGFCEDINAQHTWLEKRTLRFISTAA
jgi:predicted alpha/beta-fold hydrolase